MAQDNQTTQDRPLSALTLLPGVRLAEVGACDLGALLAEPAGTLVALCCVRGAAEVALASGTATTGADASPRPLACGEVLSLVTSGAGEKCRVRPQEGPFQGVAILASPDDVAPGAAATLAGFDVDLAELARATEAAGGVVDAAGTPASRAMLDLAVELRTWGIAALKLRCVEALRCLCDARDAAPSTPAPAPTGRAQIARLARDLMCANVGDPLTIGELARRCQTSPTVLKEAFRAEFGMPVHDWYRRYRMMRAADLLRAGASSVSDVARAVGYSNASKFAQAFNACMGATPSAWRCRAVTAVDREPVRMEPLRPAGSQL